VTNAQRRSIGGKIDGDGMVNGVVGGRWLVRSNLRTAVQLEREYTVVWVVNGEERGFLALR
jgi:hypothetical protein